MLNSFSNHLPNPPLSVTCMFSYPLLHYSSSVDRSTDHYVEEYFLLQDLTYGDGGHNWRSIIFSLLVIGFVIAGIVTAIYLLGWVRQVFSLLLFSLFAADSPRPETAFIESAIVSVELQNYDRRRGIRFATRNTSNCAVIKLQVRRRAPVLERQASYVRRVPSWWPDTAQVTTDLVIPREVCLSSRWWFPHSPHHRRQYRHHFSL